MGEILIEIYDRKLELMILYSNKLNSEEVFNYDSLPEKIQIFHILVSFVAD